MVVNKYVFDMSSGLVKISKRGTKYNIYRLKEIQEITSYKTNPI